MPSMPSMWAYSCIGVSTRLAGVMQGIIGVGTYTQGCVGIGCLLGRQWVGIAPFSIGEGVVCG